jgi:hypothetical protein
LTRVIYFDIFVIMVFVKHRGGCFCFNKESCEDG